MSKVGASIVRGLEQALAYERGTVDRSRCRVHVFVRETPEPRKARKRMPPIHPGEFLREDFLIPLEMTAEMLANEIKVPERRVVAIVKERQGLDADLCLRLSRFLGMSQEFWMNSRNTTNWRWRRLAGRGFARRLAGIRVTGGQEN